MIGVPFFKQVAEDVVSKYGTELSDMTIVFPNNRARLFFNKYLLKAVGHPIWSPKYLTISMLFEKLSSLQMSDSIKMVCIMYDVYQQILKEEIPEGETKDGYEETIDSFYNWGEMMLRDFSDVDNNYVDAKSLFQNIKDMVPFEDHSHLTEEQYAVLSHFFKVFEKGEETNLKRRFLTLWTLFGKVYERFRERMMEEGEGYEGMIKRTVIESLNKGEVELPEGRFLFVGFNVLSECERQLFKKMKNTGRAAFYWDCDSYYMGKKAGEKQIQEAGVFMKRNVEDFGNELPMTSFFKERHEMKIVAAPTDTAQAGYVTTFLKERPQSTTNEDTVIVLCNETMLLPVLHSVPDESEGGADYVNVTMGLPMVQTPIYALVRLLLNYQERLAFLDMNEGSYIPSTLLLPLLRNEYLKRSYPSMKDEGEKVERNWRYFKYKELLQGGDEKKVYRRCRDSKELVEWMLEITSDVASLFKRENQEETEFTKEEETDNGLCNSLYNALYKESVYRVYTQFQRLKGLLDDGYLRGDFVLITNLIDMLTKELSVPFTGEQADGLQVMGFLETRNLDFSSVLMLSVNEDVLPRGGGEGSFIPYALRKGYGMTTIEHKNSLYAYYFYRLIERADNVTFIYNSSSDSSSKGTMSRFLLQLMVESGQDIERFTLKNETPKQDPMPMVVPKTAEIIEMMKKKYTINDENGTANVRFLSPSSMNTFLICPFRFYMEKILHVGKEDDLTDGVEVNVFGSIFHRTMELFYKEKVAQGRRMMEKEDFPEDEKSTKFFRPKIEKLVDRSFAELYFKTASNDCPPYSGEQLMNRDAIVRYVEKMLRFDREYAPFEIIAMEQEVRYDMTVMLDEEKSIKIRLGGTIDRVDKKDGIYRILDYKTGGENKSVKMENLFTIGVKERDKYAMQILIYCYLFAKVNGLTKMKPAIAHINRSKSVDNFTMDLRYDGEKIEGIVDDYFDVIEDGIGEIVRQMFDEKLDFTCAPVENKDNDCRYCNFLSYCGRVIKKY